MDLKDFYYLHSTVVLLKDYIIGEEVLLEINLHSTVVLLKVSLTGVSVSIST